MKKLTLLIFFYSQLMFSQDVVNIFYVDNHETLSQFESIQNKLDSLIDTDFLLYISNDISPVVITDKESYNDKIRLALLSQTSRPSLKLDIRYLNNQITKYFSNYITLGKGVKNTTQVNLNFFFDMDTYCGYDLDDDFVNNLLLIYKLRTVDGVKSNCKITYNIFSNSDYECDLPNDKQITITKY